MWTGIIYYRGEAVLTDKNWVLFGYLMEICLLAKLHLRLLHTKKIIPQLLRYSFFFAFSEYTRSWI